jgi:deoxyribonuclease V
VAAGIGQGRLTRARSPSAWPDSAEALEAAQRQVAALAEAVEPWQPDPDTLSLVAGVFVAYPRGLSGVGAAGDAAWVGIAVHDGRRMVEWQALAGEAGAPYRAGYLALRDGNLLERALRALRTRPDVVLVDATGRDHPRGAGLALHLGSIVGLPTIGVTDRPLLAEGAEAGPERGAAAPLFVDGELVAYRVRTRRGVKPLVVHGGWRTSPETARELVLGVSRQSRTPEPLRQARRLARISRGRAERAGPN